MHQITPYSFVHPKPLDEHNNQVDDEYINIDHNINFTPKMGAHTFNESIENIGAQADENLLQSGQDHGQQYEEDKFQNDGEPEREASMHSKLTTESNK